VKHILIVMLLSAASWGQNGGVIPPPDIAGATTQNINSINQANTQAARADSFASRPRC